VDVSIIFPLCLCIAEQNKSKSKIFGSSANQHAISGMTAGDYASSTLYLAPKVLSRISFAAILEFSLAHSTTCVVSGLPTCHLPFLPGLSSHSSLPGFPFAKAVPGLSLPPFTQLLVS